MLCIYTCRLPRHAIQTRTGLRWFALKPVWGSVASVRHPAPTGSSATGFPPCGSCKSGSASITFLPSTQRVP